MSVSETIWLIRGGIFLAAAILGEILIHKGNDDPRVQRMQWLLFVMPFATPADFSVLPPWCWAVLPSGFWGWNIKKANG